VAAQAGGARRGERRHAELVAFAWRLCRSDAGEQAPAGISARAARPAWVLSRLQLHDKLQAGRHDGLGVLGVECC